MGQQPTERAGWLSNQPVQSKMMLGLGLVLAVFVVGTIAALVSQDRSQEALRLHSETYETIVQADELLRTAIDQQLTLRGYVITATPAILAAHQRGRAEFSRRLDALLERTADDPPQHAHLAQVQSLMRRYWVTVADPTLQWMERKRTRQAAFDLVTTGGDGRHINEIRRELEELQANEHARLAERSMSAEQRAVATRRVLIALLIGGILFGVLVLVMVREQITNPLVHLSGLMERLAARDLGIAIPEQERRDEVGAIARALEVFKANAMQLQKSEESLRRANESLRVKSDAAHHQATHDPLTNLPNRLLFMDRLAEGLERSRLKDSPVMLCYVDIDDFKPVNDLYGHQAGDVLLCQIGERLLESLRRTDTVARLGGDEFVMLLEDMEDESAAVDTVKRLCLRLGEPYVLNSPNLPETMVVEIGASIGMALFPRDADTDDALMKAADGAMYMAKQSGKNRVVRAADLARSAKRTA